MGTKVDSKSYLPVYNSMRDLNEDSSSSSWPLFYGDKPVTNNGQYYNGFMPGNLVDAYPGHEKDALKQKMLEHEAVFKNQVGELHRLYRIQRDMMEEAKRKELHKHRASMEPSSSSSHQGSRMPSEDARKWHMAGFPLSNSGYGKTGVEILDSPLSCTKGYNSAQRGQFPFQNGSTSKDLETLESRPLKVRKKLFDLQLPADDYIDTEEGEKPSGALGLADLNEPIDVEEIVAPSNLDFLGRTEGMNQTNAGGYIGVTRETNGFLINSSTQSRVNNERGRLSHLYESGSSRNNVSSVTQFREPDKFAVPSHPVQGIMLNQVHHHPRGIYPTGYNSREDHWREGPRHGLESSSDRIIRDQFNNSHLQPITSGAPFFNSSFPSSWASLNSAASTSKNLQPSHNQWQANASSSRLYPGSGSELTPVNGFYHGSASGSKELQAQLPSSGFDYRNNNCSRGENAANHGLENFQTGSCRADSRPMIDINLNEVVSTSLSNEVQDLNVVDEKSKHENNLSPLPWLIKPKSTCDNEASSSRLWSKNEMVGDLNQLASNDCEIIQENVEKIVVRENGPPSSSRVSTSASLDERNLNVDNERKNRMIDINLACEPDDDDEEIVVLEKNENSRKGIIDLNSLMSDCEDPPPPSCESRVKTTLEIDLEAPVFLENEDDDNTLSNENTLEDKNEQIRDEVFRKAVETLVSISSYCPKTHLDDDNVFIWFVDACVNEPEGPFFPNEIDDFEAMTLQLEETKEEDYMPKPFCPEFPKLDEEDTGPAQTRSRRGQSRRGRQRRDFQRDILPGLSSLSRHEVTEDIQTFGGLMRATGFNWSSGLTRRNGSGRGRRRVVVETGPVVSQSPVCLVNTQKNGGNNVNNEGGLVEDRRSLTGWGKTTRRPRRQRCAAAGNNTAAVVLS